MTRGSPATWPGALMGAFMEVPCSAAAHGDDDLEPVAVGELGLGVAAARDDLAVALDGDFLSGELERLQQARHVDRRAEAPGLAVDGQLDHEELVSSGSVVRILAPALRRPRRGPERREAWHYTPPRERPGCRQDMGSPVAGA